MDREARAVPAPLREVPESLAERLRSAAAGLTEPFAAVKVDALVEASGIPKTTLYYYFRSKDEILEFLLHDLLSAMAASVEREVAQAGSAAERLSRTIRAQFEVLAAHSGTCRAVLLELSRAGGLPAMAEAMGAAFHDPLGDLLREGAADGSLRAVDAEQTSVAIFGAITHMGFHQLVTLGHIDAEALGEHAAVMLLEGLGSRGPNGPGSRP